MARIIGIYSRPYCLQNLEDAKLYHKTTLGLNEDDKYDLPKDKIINFFMNLCLADQKFYWNEVMMIPSQKNQSAGQPMLLVIVLNTEEMQLLRNRFSLKTEQFKNWDK